MKNVLGTETTLDDAYLDGMREIQDPPADQVALGMVTRGDHVLFADLVRKHQVWEVDGQPCLRLPPDVRSYLIESSALPKWARREVVLHGEEFFLQFGISSATLLACASLPECYLMRHGTEVLCFTKFLQLDPARRIRETALMIMSVMSRGGLMPHKGVGLGVRSTQKVRLMHATIRCMIDRDPGTAANPTDAALRKAMGRPINQEDLAFTLMTFSYVAVQGFMRLGVPMTKHQQDAYVHCWNVVGYMMGIREELLPDGIEQARLLYDAIMRRQAAASQAGQQLQSALTKLLVDLMPPALKTVPVELTRTLIGDDHSTLLGITPSPARDRFLIAATLLLWRTTVRVASLLHAMRPYRLASERVHKILLDRMGNLPGHAPFNIPPEFIAQWYPERPAPSATTPQKTGTYT